MASFEKYNPATGALLGVYPVASADTVGQAVIHAREALAAWETTPLKTRVRLLKALRTRLFAQAEAVAAIISRETGKPFHDALEADVGPALNLLGYYAAHGPRLLKPQAVSPDLVSQVAGRTHQVVYRPRGVIAVIAPWNFPLAIPFSGVITALMAGNTVLLKPSELAPATGEWLITLIREVLAMLSLPENAVQCLIGDGSTGAALLAADLDGVIFTGSDRTGRAIQSQAAARNLWTSLELGGSDALLMLENTPLEIAASYALWGRFTNAGQACAAVKRLFVPENLLPEILALLQQKIERLRVGPPEPSGAHLGPLISEAQREQVHAQVQDALQQGAHLLNGGHKLPGPGYFYAPTLLTEVPPNARVLTEEIFGPVLPVIPYTTVEEAITRINASPFGLTASVFGPKAEAQRVASRLHCGTVVINGVGPSNYAMVGAPWGGWKASGPGISHGGQALRELSRTQVVTVNRLFGVPGLQKPLWHFGKDASRLPERAKAVLAFSATHASILHPRTWLAFWQNRASTRL